MNDTSAVPCMQAQAEVLLRGFWDPELEPLLVQPHLPQTASAWWGHVPFADWIVRATRPTMFVELGTHTGVSYAAFCEAVSRHRCATHCMAVDTWIGDMYTGLYGEDVYSRFRRFHDTRYAAFSSILRCTFRNALNHVADGSVDLLHIDGEHSYAAVEADFSDWLPKLSPRAVVLFHDTNEHSAGFGVWRLWSMLRRRYPSFEFLHDHGLGVLAFGPQVPNTVRVLCALSEPAQVAALRSHFAIAGERWRLAAPPAPQTVPPEPATPKAAVHEAELAAETLSVDMARRTPTHQRLREEAARAKTKIAELETELALCRRQCQALLSSTSWRITAPLRRVATCLPATARLTVTRALRFHHQMGADLLISEQDWTTPNLAALTPAAYNAWILQHDKLTSVDRAAIRLHVTRMQAAPLISVVMPVYNTPAALLEAAIASVRAQLYPYWELCIADDASTAPHVARLLHRLASDEPRVRLVRRHTNGHISRATNTALDLATGEFVALLDHDDLLHERALYEVAAELERHPDADVLYSDEDQVDESGLRQNPYFKPGWNPDLLLSHNIVSHLGVYRRTLLDRIGRLRPEYDGSQDYDLALRATAATKAERIRHIPLVLYHWRRGAASEAYSEHAEQACIEAARRAVAAHLWERGVAADVTPAPGQPLWSRVRYPIPAGEAAPLVSLIIPTRDRVELLAACLDGLLNRTTYRRIEVLVADNGSREVATKQFYQRIILDPRVRVIDCAGPFNYSAINNRAAQQALGEILVLLNNDTEVIEPEWLAELVSHALRPEVGAVGAKLLYSDGRVQHAGVTLGLGGVAGHTFQMLDSQDNGYFGHANMVRNVQAVTGACLALRREVFEAVGGLDEIHLPVAFNDVDLCLRLVSRGLINVWTPYAQLIHHESVSRGQDTTTGAQARFSREIAYMRQKWCDLLQADPYHNANLDLEHPDYHLASKPRRTSSWLVGTGSLSMPNSPTPSTA